METDVCQVVLINSANVDRAAQKMPDDSVLTWMAETLRLLGDPTRLRILHALTTTELCVCDLSVLIETTSSAISHQLRLLRTSGLVTFRREGKMVYYSLNGSNARLLLSRIAALRPIESNQET